MTAEILGQTSGGQEIAGRRKPWGDVYQYLSCEWGLRRQALEKVSWTSYDHRDPMGVRALDQFYHMLPDTPGSGTDDTEYLYHGG
jgi:hypothetical protein